MKNRGFEVCSKYIDKDVKLPTRMTKTAVGYDFFSPIDFVIPTIWKSVFKLLKKKHNCLKPTLVPTGIKSYFNEDEVLILANKSSFPLKKGLVMANGIGIVENDYYNNDSNEGELFFQYYNVFPKDIKILKGDRIGQAYFQKFLVADNDQNSNSTRTGGFGSTN